MSEVIKLTGLDECIAGMGSAWDSSGARVDRLIYDGPKLIELFQREGLSEEEAIEHIEYNIEGGYVGPATPIVMWPAEPDNE